jgi:hypothetical protein
MLEIELLINQLMPHYGLGLLLFGVGLVQVSFRAMGVHIYAVCQVAASGLQAWYSSSESLCSYHY